MGKTIAVLNQKGGVGKTTTVINTATYLSRSDRKILIIDLDPQANATSGLGINKMELKNTSKELLLETHKVQDSIIKLDKNLDLIGSNQNLATLEIDLVNQDEREFKLRKSILNSKYDYIIIDCPPSLSLLTVNALSASNFVLIPVQAEYYALEGLSQLLEVMQLVKDGLNPSLELIGVLITMYDSRTSLSSQVKNELEDYFGDKIFDNVIPRNVRLAEAPSHGMAINNYDKWSKGARAYKQFSKEFLDRLENS